MRPSTRPCCEDLADHPVGPRCLDERVGGRCRAEHERGRAVDRASSSQTSTVVGSSTCAAPNSFANPRRAALRSTATTSSMPPSARVTSAQQGRSGHSRRPPPCRPVATSAWRTACSPTASGSVSAATRRGIPSGTGNSRRLVAASRTKSSGVRPPSAAPLPSPAHFVVAGVDDDPVAGRQRPRRRCRPTPRCPPSRGRGPSAAR